MDHNLLQEEKCKLFVTIQILILYIFSANAILDPI